MPSDPRQNHQLLTFSQYNIDNAFRWISHYDVASFVPVDSDISYSDLAAKSGTNQDITQRMLRYLMTSNIFHEPRPGIRISPYPLSRSGLC